MQHYIDVVQDRSGNAIGNAIVTVKNNSSGQTAPTYSDSAGLIPLTSIMTANNGTFSFYIESGRYNISITKNGVLLNAINDIFITVTADYPTAMSQYDAIAGINLTPQTISADVLQGAMPTAMSYADAIAGTSTTPQSIAPNVLVASNIVQKYASVNNIPANFVGIAKVGTDLYVGNGTSVVAVGGVALIPTLTDATTQAANTVTLQAAVNLKGTIKILTPGDYYFDGDPYGIITIGDDTTIEVGAGVVLRPTNGTLQTKPLFVNKNWRSNKGTISSITATTTAPYTTFVATEAGHTRQVGDYVMIKGETTGVYNNIWKISARTSTTWSVKFSGYNSGTLAPANGTGTMIAYAANSNIHVIGDGRIDCGYNLNNAGSLNSLTTMGNFMNKVSRWSWHLRVDNTIKYGLYYCNSYYADIGNVVMESTSSWVQGQGPLYCTWIHDVVAYGSYDDIMPVLVNNGGFTQYDLLDADGTKNSDGDVIDTTIENIFMEYGGSRKILIQGGTGGIVRNFTVNNIKCRNDHSGIVITFEVPSTQSATFTNITLSNIYLNGQQSNTEIIVLNSITGAGLATFNNLTLDTIVVTGSSIGGSNTGLTSALLYNASPVVINGLKVTNITVEYDLSATMIYPRGLLSFGNTTSAATVRDLKVNNVRLTGTGTSKSLQIVNLGGNANFDLINIENCYINGNLNCFVDNEITSNTNLDTGISAKININNCTMMSPNGQGLVTTSGQKNFVLSICNTQSESNSYGAIYVFAGTGATFEINLSNVRTIYSLIQNLGTSHTFYIRTANVASTTYLPGAGTWINFGTTSTWKFIGDNSGLSLDVSGISKVEGTKVFNTNAALGTLGHAGVVECQYDSVTASLQWVRPLGITAGVPTFGKY